MKIKIKKFRRPSFSLKKINWLKVIQVILTVLMAFSLLATPLVGVIYVIS